MLELVSYAWAGFGAAFGPALILSLFWKGMNRAGAIAGIIVGGVTVVVWGNISGGIFDLYEIVPGFILAAIAIVVVSKVFGTPHQDILEQFDRAMGRGARDLPYLQDYSPQ